ncbi:hypothetical protein P692DRAFT_20847918 [Suillus brevipes Sb2]|nr:hypothetical protein P692DRAFT_20847918 [Suillus brevipes Sb2]
MTPLDTLTHRRRTFQPAVMESGRISYETILHTMQLLHVSLLPANQVWSSCSRCQSQLAIQKKQPSEASFNSPSMFHHVISISRPLAPLWPPALASSGSPECSGIGSSHVLEGLRDASYMMGWKILTHSDHMCIPNLAEVCLETFNGDLQFYSTCEPHSDTTPRFNSCWLTCHNIQGLKAILFRDLTL